MSKQTALQWYRLESQKLMIKAIRKEISNEEWRLLENKLGEEAKAMHKEEMITFTADWIIQWKDGDRYSIKEYYEQTYGGNNDN